MMVIAFAAALVALTAWIRWVWRRTLAPVWASLAALGLVGLGAWCVVEMAASFISAYRVPVILPGPEQMRQVAMYDGLAYRWGMRFWAAGLVSTGWLLFAMWRWEASPQDTNDERSDPK